METSSNLSSGSLRTISLASLDYPVSSKLRFSLNGELVELDNPDPRKLLVHWLRESGHTGTKFSCGQGGCGACTVNIRPWPKSSSETPAKYMAVNGCLRPLVAVHEMDVLTVEGLVSYSYTHKQLDPVQERIAMYNGSQCGWCTPGFVMGMNAYLDNTEEDKRTIVDIENAFDGHLCRCTGFRPILCGMKTFAKCGNKDELTHTPPLMCDTSVSYSAGTIQHPNVHVVHQEQESEEVDIPDIFVARNGDTTWFGLRTISQLWSLLWLFRSKRKEVRIVAGNTAYGIQPVQPKIEEQKTMLFVGHIPELTSLDANDACITARCSVPIQHLLNHVRHLAEAHKSGDKRSSYPPSIAYNHWKRLATTEIRNVGSIGGNFYLAKECQFPSDLVLVLTTLGAAVNIAGPNSDHTASTQKTTMTVIDFLNTPGVLDGTSIIYEITVPIAIRSNVFIRTYKVSQRPQNSHSIVNAGFSAKVEETGFQDVCIAFGNIALKICRMSTTEKWMQNNCTPATLYKQLPKLLEVLTEELMLSVVPKKINEEQYRIDMARNLFYKYLIKMACVFKLPDWTDLKELKSAPKSIVNRRFTVASSGQQDFCVYSDEYPVSEPIVKQSAFVQATGEAKYTQDLGRQAPHLNGVYILNMGKKAEPYANFRIEIPSDLQEKFPDVVTVFTAKDLMKPTGKLGQSVYPRNSLGAGQTGFPGDTLFAQEKVIYIGQPVGMVVAKTEESAREAAQWLQDCAITYTKLESVVTLDEAIDQKRFFADRSTDPSARSRILKISRPVSASTIDWKQFEDDPDVIVLEGSQRAGSQYHFYMETQSAIAYPTEEGGVKVYASTQSPDIIQREVAKVCNLAANLVTIKITRIGGGYGGKEVQSKFVPSAAAFCACQLQQPVRVVNFRVEDMQMIGKRHAYLGKFKVAAKKDGTIKALHFHFYSDGGCTYDATFPEMDLALLSSDNAYNIQQFLAQGNCAMTNKATSTAFRAFGVIQTMLIVEAAIEAVAEKLDIPDDKLREKNFYQVNDFTPFGQQLLYCNLDGVWQTIKKTSDYEARKKAVQDFNKNNRYKKRGIKMIPLKYGISFTFRPKNQGSAAINVYHHDGTVLLSHGGVEMGQGLNTKMMQIVASELHVPIEIIRVSPNNTDKIANATSTGASTGADLNGGAVKAACSKLRERLVALLKQQGKPLWFKTNREDSSLCTKWKDVVALAYYSRVSLMSKGYFSSPDLDEINDKHPQGRAFYYFNYAAAVSEVEIDSLTGESTIIRSDIVYDAGHSLNPAIDVGQIEGGFVMGIGNVTTEELVYDDNGRLQNDGTWEYKPPCSKTIPQDLRVTIYPGAHHKEHSRPIHRIDHKTSNTDSVVYIDPHGIQSSKTTGEPPLVLANSVFFAIKQAVTEARKEVGVTGPFTLDSPATVERIQRACAVTPLTHLLQ